ncbi:MAG: VCBS repeat-containing protein [Pseudooceanicola sp.]|nr:VCBS repeat-containing protein [Pseudooceanicola sp.]
MDVSDRFELTFETGPRVAMPTVTFVQPLDANGDGITDILVATDNYGDASRTYPAYLMLGKADGGFKLGAKLPGRYVPRDMTTGDYNGDGVLDFYVSYTGPDTNPAPGERDVLMLSDGGGGWTAAKMPNPANGFSHSATSGDIDGDGDLDIYVQTNGNGDNANPYLLINDGDGGFTLNRTRLAESLATQNDWSSTRRQHWTEMADLNGDGLVDLVTGKQEQPGTPRSSMVYLNQGGSFDDAHAFVLPDHPKLKDAEEVISIRAADLDGDGKDELIVLGQGRREGPGAGYTEEYAIQVFDVAADGSLTDESARWFGPGAGYFAGGNLPYFLEIMDVNGDGRLDILPFMPGGGLDSKDVPMVLLNGGEGVFQAITAADIDPERTFMFGTSEVPVLLDGQLRFYSFGITGEGRLDWGVFSQVAPLPAFIPRIWREGDGVVSGGRGADWLFGRGGEDTLRGRAGADELHGRGGDDVLLGHAGADEIFGDLGADRLNGGGGNDALHGGVGKDVLVGGAGNDTLWGEGGNDVLKGGRGADHFHFAKGDGADRIADFRDDVDTIHLSRDLGISTRAQAMAHAEQDGDRVVFTFDTGDRLVVSGAELSQLQNDLILT